MSFQDFMIGLVGLIIGAVSLRYNYQLVGFTGHVGFIERYMGYGSTYFVFKMISVVVCIVAFLFMFGLAEPFFTWLLSPLAQFFVPPADRAS